MTIDDMSLLTGLSTASISRIENNKQTLTVDTAQVIAEAYGVDAGELVNSVISAKYALKN